MSNALIIVDLQTDFISGSLAVPGGEEVAQKIGAMGSPGSNYDLDYAYAYVVTTQDWHINPGDHFSDDPDYVKTWPPHCVAGTPGAELHEALSRISIDREFWKGHWGASYSGFDGFDEDGSPLESYLRDVGVTHVDIVGIATDHCVKATALDAARLGFNTAVLRELTVAVTPEGWASAVKELHEAGVFI